MSAARPLRAFRYDDRWVVERLSPGIYSDGSDGYERWWHDDWNSALKHLREEVATDGSERK